MDIALVHGSYHGAWCWDLLRPELEALGHHVIAMDLPISEPGLGAADYADAVVRALEGCDAPVVVGHSMAGLVIPIVAERRPVRRIVFLAAFLPEPGRTINQQRASEPIDGRIAPTTAEWSDLGDGVWMVGPATATEIFYHDVAPEIARWAVGQLRPQSYALMDEVTPLAAWPAVESSVIVCADDHAMNPDWLRAATRDRLGLHAAEIAGGHSPFLTRPAELAQLIDSLAR